MRVDIELDDRQYRDIESYCNVNNIPIHDYLVGIITEKHAINKYGDLNELMPIVIDESKVEVKRRGRPKKVVEDTQPKETLNTTENTNEVKSITQTTNTEEPKTTPTVKRKRTLKTL